ncbi:MAG: hypothetical protein CSA62_01605 [Planctomycetota bacterium]|nr:MAG: hypothetical protein CSA62_01605 [Planctomycetota bacterium]
MKISLRHLPLTGLALMLAIGSTTAQAEQQAKFQANYEKKVQEDWFVKGKWVDDFDTAKERAKKENKVVFAYFTRSYSP